MNSLLYYSISSSFNKDEIIKIDKQVAKNREAVYLFVRKLPSNSKSQAKKTFLSAIFIFQIGQSLVPCAAAVMLSLPPVSERLSLFEQDKILENKNYYPQIDPIIESKNDKMVLTDEQIEDFNLILAKLQKGSITENKAILGIRGGGFYDWATLAFIILMYSLHQGDNFESVPLPHQDPMGWLTGKYNHKHKPNRSTSYKSSRFELQMAGVNDNMCPGLAMADENGFVMSYPEAYNLVAETYPGYLKVNESCKITDWQGAKHIYHLKGMGGKPENYGFTQKELERIRGEARYKEGGLIAYARRGYKLPPIEMILDYQLRLKESCEKSPIKRTKVPYYDSNGVWEARVFATPPIKDSSSKKSSGVIIAFNESTGDLITGDRQKTTSFNRFKNENYLGSKKWMTKWSNQ